MEIFEVKNLRNNLKVISRKNPGIYKFCATKEIVLQIFKILEIERERLSELENFLYKGTLIYVLYVGIATGQSLYERAKKHIKKNIKYSTLRMSLAAILKSKKEEELNTFIDNLFYIPKPFELQIKSKEAKEIIEAEELKEINRYFRPLNLEGNIKKVPKLTQLRREIINS